MTQIGMPILLANFPPTLPAMVEPIPDRVHVIAMPQSEIVSRTLRGADLGALLRHPEALELTLGHWLQALGVAMTWERDLPKMVERNLTAEQRAYREDAMAQMQLRFQASLDKRRGTPDSPSAMAAAARNPGGARRDEYGRRLKIWEATVPGQIVVLDDLKTETRLNRDAVVEILKSMGVKITHKQERGGRVLIPEDYDPAPHKPEPPEIGFDFSDGGE